PQRVRDHVTVATEPLSETAALSRFETDVFATDSHLSARRGSSSSKQRSYCYAKSYVLSCGFGRSCPRVYLYADEGTKSRVSISRVSTGVIAAADFPHTAGTGTTCATNQVSEGSKCSSE